MSEWFASWFNSPYYHLLYKNRSEQEAIEFVNNLVEKLGLSKEDVLLDMACGRGRHALAFAAHHMDVTGVDLSSESIAEASKMESDNLTFYIHDMRQVFRANYYTVVSNLFTSFGYFKRLHENSLAATSMYVALRKKGTLIVDFVNQSFARASIDANREEEVVLDNIVFKIQRSYTKEMYSKKILVQDGASRFSFEEVLQSFTLQQMIDIFTAVGFSFEQVYGNYRLETYVEKDSPRMICIFRK
jgi:ubiquinone/menaquinone biosynthesis C-methylase UbiE